MAAQSLLAKLGMRAGTLGTAATLALAAPLSEGDPSTAAHTAASRIGWYFDRSTPGSEKVGHVIMGTEVLSVAADFITAGKPVRTPASASGGAGLNIGQGTAPSSPVNGDLWVTTAGLFARVNGGTVGPYTSSGGSVSSVSVVTANGVSGSVANPTTTPAITLTLGAITPSSVAATGAITGSNLISGTGSPQGVVTAAVGTIYERTDGGAGTSLYVKESGAGNVGWSAVATGPAGTVTSVDVGVPVFMTSTGGPITTSGTITLGFGTQSQNLVFASPSGSTGFPSFRALVSSDLPAGTGTIGGSIASTQIAVGSGSNTVAGSSNFTFNGSNLLQIAGASGFSSASSGQALIGVNATNGLVIVANGGNQDISLADRNTVSALKVVSGGYIQIPVRAHIGTGNIDASSNAFCQTAASISGQASLNVPPGTAPTSPFDGDIWTTTAGMFVRINGATQQLGVGTVTSVSVTTANGVSGSVATATTTPAITLTLGAITPTSVAATGTITGSNVVRGSGSPEGVVTAAVGSIYERTDGGAGTSLYVKESGVGNTGWVAMATSSGGTVTTVSVTTANGVSGSVATPTSTPAITLTLGAITPSSVAATGVITGSNLIRGTGTPEGSVTATVGALYERTDGGSGTTLYIKESGSGNTGWTAVSAGTATIGGSIASGQVAFGAGTNTIQGSSKITFSASTGLVVNLASSGADNLTIGNTAGDSLTSGAQNTLLGTNAGTALTTTNDTTAVGYNALAACTVADNVAVGSGAMDVATTATRCTAVGKDALGTITNTSNNDCTAVGYQALNSITGGVSGIRLTALGSLAGTGITDSVRGVFIGDSATGAASGSNQVAVGSQASAGDGATAIGYSTTSGTNSVVVGNSASAGTGCIVLGCSAASTGSNQFVIGGDSTTNRVLNMYLGRGVTGSVDSDVQINATGASGSNTAGCNLNICGGKSTGTGVGGSVTLQTSPAGTTGSSLNALAIRLTVDQKGNIVPGTGALSTSATDGFTYIETCAGPPTGVPTSFTGRAAMVYDSTNNKLYVYNGAWKGVTLT